MSEIKYKLLRELPFCEVGDIGYIKEGLLQFDYIDYENQKNQHNFGKLEIKNLIEQGWIEEYKPKTQKELADRIISNYSDNYSSLTEEKQFEWIKEFCDLYEIKEKQ